METHIEALTLFTPCGEKRYVVGGTYKEIRGMYSTGGRFDCFRLIGYYDETLQIVSCPSYSIDTVTP